MSCDAIGKISINLYQVKARIKEDIQRKDIHPLIIVLIIFKNLEILVSYVSFIVKKIFNSVVYSLLFIWQVGVCYEVQHSY